MANWYCGWWEYLIPTAPYKYQFGKKGFFEFSGEKRKDKYKVIIIKDGKLIIGNDERTIDEDTFQKLRKRTKLAKGDILMSSVGTIGETYLLNEEPSCFEFQRSVAIIKPDKKYVNSCYMYEMLKSMRAILVNASHGAAQQCLFIGDINRINVCLPPISICDVFDSKVQQIYDMILILTKQNQLLPRQRDLLLPRLMSGKIAVNA